MSDLKLDLETGDLVLEDGDLLLDSGQEAIQQNLYQRLKCYKGEWFLDLSDGVPYYQDILKKNPNPLTVDAALKTAILGTPGVLELTSFNLNLDTVTRTLYLDFIVDTIEGEIDFSSFEL